MALHVVHPQDRSSKKVMLDTVCDALELLRMDRLLGYASIQALASGVAGMLFDLVCYNCHACAFGFCKQEAIISSQLSAPCASFANSFVTQWFAQWCVRKWHTHVPARTCQKKSPGREWGQCGGRSKPSACYFV